jgi:hypothetical protein
MGCQVRSASQAGDDAYIAPNGVVSAANQGVLKSIGYLLLTASAVSLYLHVRNHDFSRTRSVKDPSPAPTPGEIVIARSSNGTFVERWGNEASPTPITNRR